MATKNAEVKQLKRQMAQMQKYIDSLKPQRRSPRKKTSRKRVAQKPTPRKKTAQKRGGRAAPGALPFAGYDRIRSQDRKQSLALIRSQTAPTLRRALSFERSHQNRRIISGWLQETLQRLEAGLPATPRRGRPPVAKAPRGKRTAKRAAKKVTTKRTGARRGRPSLAERPHQMVGRPPLADYPRWSITSLDPANNMRQRVLELEDAKLTRRLLEFEAAQPRPRRTALHLLRRRLRALTGEGAAGGRVQHNTQALPFPAYVKVASSRQKVSRDLLRRQDTATLQAALKYERKYIGRAQIIDMIESLLREKQAQQLPKPFRAWDRVASSNLTETRHVLAGCNARQLADARRYERATRNRVQVLRAIDEAEARLGGPARKRTTRKPAGRKRTARKPAGRKRATRKPAARKPAARKRVARRPVVAGELPFPGYERLRSQDRKGSLALIRAQDAETLRRAVAYEGSHRNRASISGWLQETLQRLEAGLPATPRRGRPPKAAAPAVPGELPFPGYDQLRSSDPKRSRSILIGRTADELQAGLEYERSHQNRQRVVEWQESVLRQKQAGRPARGMSEPLEDYDALPAEQVVRTVERGLVDDRLDSILAYERSSGQRAAILRAVEERMRQPRAAGIVSPSGRAWKGREPWPGYGSLNHDDRPGLLRAFSERSAPELRRVAGAEARQDFPSQTAIDVAQEALGELART